MTASLQRRPQPGELRNQALGLFPALAAPAAPPVAALTMSPMGLDSPAGLKTPAKAVSAIAVPRSPAAAATDLIRGC